MTLVLSYVCERYAVQVADRLVTRNTGQVFDSLANKTVVYLCQDAILSLGYTGNAYLKNMPTDVWLSEYLTGWDLKARGHTRFGSPHQYRFHDAIEMLAREFGQILPRQQIPFELAIVGWKWRKSSRRLKRADPVAMTITYTSGGGLRINRLPRHWQHKGVAFKASPACNLSQDLYGRIKSSLLSQAGHDHAEGILSEAIRAMANVNPRVGGNCMSIVLAPPHHACYGRVRFLPFDVSTQELRPPLTKSPVVYSPWVITPSAVIAPSEMVSGAVLNFNKWRIQIDAPIANSLIWRSQARPELR